jgi:DNA-binding NarL/FixJ family response regulator
MKPKPKLLVIAEKPQSLEFLGDFGYEFKSYSSVKKALEYLRYPEDLPDLFLIDVTPAFSGGWEILKFIRNNENIEYLPVIVISDLVEKTDELLALRSGADDFVKKPFDVDILLARVDAALRRTMWNKLAFVDLTVLPFKKPPKDVQSLTTREATVLDMIAKGHSNDDIAKTLCLSKLTVKTHIKNIFKKLNVNNRTEAILVGLKLGLIKT